MSNRWEFYRHMPVYLSNGRRLGRTEEIAHGEDYLHIQQGRVLIRDWYVPMSAVEQVSAAGVELNVVKADLQANGWDVPPEPYLRRQGATHGYEYSSAESAPESRTACSGAAVG